MDATLACNEYTLLVVAGPSATQLPKNVRYLMEEHLKNCAYHRSSRFAQSCLGINVIPEMEKAAQELVEKLRA